MLYKLKLHRYCSLGYTERNEETRKERGRNVMKDFIILIISLFMGYLARLAYEQHRDAKKKFFNRGINRGIHERKKR